MWLGHCAGPTLLTLQAHIPQLLRSLVRFKSLRSSHSQQTNSGSFPRPSAAQHLGRALHPIREALSTQPPPPSDPQQSTLPFSPQWGSRSFLQYLSPLFNFKIIYNHWSYQKALNIVEYLLNVFGS